MKATRTTTIAWTGLLHIASLCGPACAWASLGVALATMQEAKAQTTVAGFTPGSFRVLEYSKATTNTYTNDTVNWFLGRLVRSQVTSTTP